MGFFVNGMLGGYGALMSELYPTVARATAQNVLFNIGRAIGGFGPVAVAAIAVRYGFETAIALLAVDLSAGHAGAVAADPGTPWERSDVTAVAPLAATLPPDARPTGSATEQSATVAANTLVNAGVPPSVLRAAPPATDAAPGQFFQLLCPAPPGEAPFLRRPMSVYGADPAAGEVAFLYKVTGAGTAGLATLGPGDTLDIMGPLGRGFTLDPAWRSIAAVGRGAGLATLGPLAQAAQARGIAVTAVLSARRPDLVVSDALFRACGASVIAVTDAEGTSGPMHVERAAAPADRGRSLRRVLHLRLGPAAAGAADAWRTSSGCPARWRWSNRWRAVWGCASAACGRIRGRSAAVVA